MALSTLAGKHPPKELLIDVDRLRGQYYAIHPDVANAVQRVAFGTSGHRGTSENGSFNEDHIAAIATAIVEYRTTQGITGPLYLGMDSHALSEPAQQTVVEVLAAHGVTTFVATGAGAAIYTPTPVISHAILTYNRDRRDGLADGIVITPSHNPPNDGGIKYNPPNGGPADTNVTGGIEKRANAILANKLADVKRLPYATAIEAETTRGCDYITPYVNDLDAVIDMAVIRASGLALGADPLGGASLAYWEPIADRYKLNLTLVNRTLDPTFAFMPVDHDGKIRMDCSSPYAMADLVQLKDAYAIAWGNDTDSDRHGIVTPSAGLMNPNAYLAVAIWYLFQNRPEWRGDSAIGKTLVSSGLIDRVGKSIGRKVVEVPVGFKWFVDGLLSGDLGFGGEESAGASFLRKNGAAWSTDKDGPIMDLLAAEITARTGKNPSQHYDDLTAKLGKPFYSRVDAPANAAQKAKLKSLSPDAVKADTLAGDPIVAKLTRAPGNNAEIGGLKVTTESGWFAARPSGTEDVYKIYAESFADEAHLQKILDEARDIVSAAF